MTQEEIKIFKEEFKKVVAQKSFIVKLNSKISQLSLYDKSGSHNKAIINVISEKKEQKIKFDNLLQGKTYKEWTKASRDISIMERKLKSAKQDITIQKILKQIKDFSFPIKFTFKNSATLVENSTGDSTKS